MWFDLSGDLHLHLTELHKVQTFNATLPGTHASSFEEIFGGNHFLLLLIVKGSTKKNKPLFFSFVLSSPSFFFFFRSFSLFLDASIEDSAVRAGTEAFPDNGRESWVVHRRVLSGR